MIDKGEFFQLNPDIKSLHSEALKIGGKRV